jgi:hypothetical protein
LKLRVLILFSCSLLSACAGPLSLVSYAVGAGVAMHADDEARELKIKEQYTDRCLPTHRRENPMVSAGIKEQQGDPVTAYGLYMVAQQLGYGNAKLASENLRSRMTVQQRALAQKEISRYSAIHISSCFYPDAWLHSR